MNKHKNIPIFVSHMGCPHDCVFCNQKKIASDVLVNAKTVNDIIEKSVSTLKENDSAEIAFFGGSFSGIDVKSQIEFLSIAKGYVDSGKVKGIRLSTRPDLIDDEILERFLKYNVTAIELGAQSLNDEVLLASCRGHSAFDVENSAKKIKEYPFELGLQMMLGLPTDTVEKSIYTARKIVELGADTTRIYPTTVIKGTMLEEMYQKGEYIPLTVENAVEWCEKIVPIFDEKVKILRVGLMANDNLTKDNDLIAGAFHPAFGELVWSRIFRSKISDKLMQGANSVTILCNPRDVSKITGNKSENTRYFMDKYFIKRMKIKGDHTIAKGEFKILE